MDDFTFPAAAAASVVEDTQSAAEYKLCLHRHRHHGLLAFRPDCVTSSSPPLWFAAAAPVAVSRAADDMGGHAHGLDDGELVRGAGAGAVLEGEDKMDLLWENFNEELEALRRAGSCSKASAASCGEMEPWDAESERGRAGCAPMLMASSRAGGTGHYHRTSSWVLLMRIFKRLFVVEKTTPAGRSAAAGEDTMISYHAQLLIQLQELELQVKISFLREMPSN